MALIRRRNTRSKSIFMNFRSEVPGNSSTHVPRHQDTMMVGMDVEALKSSKTRSVPIEMPKARNIVIFGDSGVGKSSLINMLAGQTVAKTSSGVVGCTFQSSKYGINLKGEDINVWDTAGLDEGTRGRVPPKVAEENLTQLLRGLRSANGIHLLVYCIRGPSVRKSLTRNYLIFYSAICRKKVPIVAVVTGLENEPISMDNWWTRGEKELAKYKMHFDAHACVTTIDMKKLAGTVFEERGKSSQDMVRNLIFDNCHRTAIRPPSDPNIFIKAALHDFRSMMKAGWENVGPTSTVAFCQTDVQLFHAGVFGDLRQIHSQINGRSFVFQNAGDLTRHYVNPRLSKGGADLLIFAGERVNSNLRTFQDFYAACNGEVCPLLVITSEGFVDEWQRYLNDQGIGARVESFRSDGRTPADLLGLIDELCLVRGPTKFGNKRILRFWRRRSGENADDGM